MSYDGGSFRQIQDELLQLLTGRALKTMQAEGELFFKTARRLKAFPTGWALIEMGSNVSRGLIIKRGADLIIVQCGWKHTRHSNPYLPSNAGTSMRYECVLMANITRG